MGHGVYHAKTIRSPPSENTGLLLTWAPIIQQSLPLSTGLGSASCYDCHLLGVSNEYSMASVAVKLRNDLNPKTPKPLKP